MSVAYTEKLVDEAHCVKMWGDKFRTAIAQIEDLCSLIPTAVNRVALTATATSESFTVVTSRLSTHSLTSLQREYR